MVTAPTTDADAWQDLAELRDRLDYEGSDLFSDNEQLRFDELLVRLEREARDIFVTNWGDQPVIEETGRTDEKRATDDAALPLVYPIQTVTQVETKQTLGDDWTVLDADRYDWTDHRLILEHAKRHGPRGRFDRGNPLDDYALRSSWGDIAAKVRVTYDRGFDPVPADVKSVQVQIVNQLLRQLKREQTVAAASPEEFAGQTENNEIVTDEIRARIADVTSPSLATFSV